MFQLAYDFFTAPIRMVLFPDHIAERFHITSLRAERLAVVLPELRGRCLDIGAGDNTLVRLYTQMSEKLGIARGLAVGSVGVDIVDWGGGCQIIKSSEQLPFPDASFDTVSFIACLNHIPERAAALVEARRVLRPGGRIVITMIGRFTGKLGHAIWWYSEDKHREVDEHEEMGLNQREVLALLAQAGFKMPFIKRFVYRLNYLYIAQRD